MSRREDDNGSFHSTERRRRGQKSADHLLNFTYASPRNQDESSGRMVTGSQWRGGRVRRQPVHTKEQFLQAHCQFVVKNSGLSDDYACYLADCDKMVDWEDIEQVVSYKAVVIHCAVTCLLLT